ncbi:hypothetical protein ACLOJK_035291 [Asimina triloba]
MYTVDLDDNDVQKKAKNIILEILLRLPLQSLFRFTSVSRRHHTLITYPAFLHRYRSYSSTGVLLCNPLRQQPNEWTSGSIQFHTFSSATGEWKEKCFL